ncbi:hypothetical protein L1987_48306 [Smallanthus sonchifolius]|uniref:Uncharacterized protein n=1 Tax=Smallanthus sonchifolius TaxID=185202 RepID=A0ACB9FRA3_9ASTR|nr:hypothetical protein L1987_48306 [Smallanthus sonchifolius]
MISMTVTPRGSYRRGYGCDRFSYRHRHILLYKDVVWTKKCRLHVQTLDGKVFKDQIGKNLEVYVDDLVIKSRNEKIMLADISETFIQLKKEGIKMNPVKCSFRMEEGKFLGVIVTREGIRVNPEKMAAITCMTSPKSLNEVQTLNGRLVAMNRFLEKHAEKSLPFIATLKNCLTKSDFKWSAEAEKAFQDKSSVDLNYQGGWAIELGVFELAFKPRSAIKGQVIADFITEVHAGTMKGEEAREVIEAQRTGTKTFWELFTDGAACIEGSGAIEKEARRVCAHVDSLLVANQINGIYKAKGPIMIRYLSIYRNLLKRFASWEVIHIPRSQNKKSDALSKIDFIFSDPMKTIHLEMIESPSTEITEVNVTRQEESLMTLIRKYLDAGILPLERSKAYMLQAKSA